MKAGIISIIALLVVILISCQSQDELEFKRYYTTGKVVYQSKCQNCHGDNGQGLSALIPPLTDSVYLQANKHELPCIIKHGLNKPITVHGKAFLGQMPATDLAPVEMAEVITYITNSFGNKMGVTTTQMAEDDLNECE
ncbi:MAG: c-type cytochrome [Sphingobacteriaceae bacterium]|nr:MAG: c-type cytochrome [Sphingobacteriaceae bacterium]